MIFSWIFLFSLSLAITLFCFRFHSFSSSFWYHTITTLSCASFVAVLCFLFVFKVVDLAISSGYTSSLDLVINCLLRNGSSDVLFSSSAFIWFMRSLESISLFPAGRRNDMRFRIWCRSWVFFFFFFFPAQIFVFELQFLFLNKIVLVWAFMSFYTAHIRIWRSFQIRELCSFLKHWYMCTPVFLLWIHKDSAFRAFLKLFFSNICGSGVLHRSLLQECSDIVVRH